jgi:hypothetical protein
VAKKGKVMEAAYAIGFLVTSITSLKFWLDNKALETRLEEIDEQEIQPLLSRINYLEGENIMLIRNEVETKVH